MGDIAEFVKKNPALIGIAVALVALYAWWVSTHGTTTTSDPTFTGGGTVNAPVDPGVVAMEQARIAAGAQNIGTLASLLLGEEQSQNAQESTDAQTAAALSASLASTSANRDVSLAGIAAQEEVANQQTNAGVYTAQINATAASHAADLTAMTQGQIIQANAQAAQGAQNVELETLATQRDVARVNAKSHWWSDLFSFGKGIADVITFGAV